MSITIPSTKAGGGEYVRNYENNAYRKITQFKTKIELLDEHYHKDPSFYIETLRTIFESNADFLGGATDYSLLYDATILHNFLIDQFYMNDFHYFVQSIIDRFKISEPLIHSFYFIVDMKPDTVSEYESIQDKLIEYIQEHDIQLKMKHTKPHSDLYETTFNQYLKKINPPQPIGTIDIPTMVQTLQKNMKEYIHALDIVLPYIIDLETFYIELADKLYAYKSK